MTTLTLNTEVKDMSGSALAFVERLASGTDDDGHPLSLFVNNGRTVLILETGPRESRVVETLDIAALVTTWVRSREAEAKQLARENEHRTPHEDGGYTYDHEARPDDDAEPGDRCKDCGGDLFWLGSSPEWLHVEDVMNQ